MFAISLAVAAGVGGYARRMSDLYLRVCVCVFSLTMYKYLVALANAFATAALATFEVRYFAFNFI